MFILLSVTTGTMAPGPKTFLSAVISQSARNFQVLQAFQEPLMSLVWVRDCPTYHGMPKLLVGGAVVIMVRPYNPHLGGQRQHCGSASQPGCRSALTS